MKCVAVKRPYLFVDPISPVSTLYLFAEFIHSFATSVKNSVRIGSGAYVIGPHWLHLHRATL